MKRTLLKLLVITVFVFTLAAFIVIREDSRRIYNYDPAADYEYSFSSNAVQIIKLDLEDNSFLFPLLEGAADTLFLKIRVNSSLLAQVWEPYIQISYKGVKLRQYLERGARGIRYINISHLSALGLSKAGEKISLKGGHIKWQKEAQLLIFRNEEPDKKRILIVAAHPDDAEIAAFGFYSHRNSYIVTITAGDSGTYQYHGIYPDPKLHYFERAKMRVWDSITVPFLGGIGPERSLNLGYFDNTLKKMHDHPSVAVAPDYAQITDVNTLRNYNLSSLVPGHSGEATWLNLVDDLTRIIQELKPEIIVVHHPLLDSRPDHKFAALAVLEAISKAGLKNGNLYLYVVKDLYGLYYPFGPMGTIVSLPPFFNHNVLFRKVYSYHLSDQCQKEKIFALEAMHSLRSAPPFKVQREPLFTLKRIILDNLRKLREFFRGDISYYRKAVRANELFFVLPFEDVDSLLAP